MPPGGGRPARLRRLPAGLGHGDGHLPEHHPAGRAARARRGVPGRPRGAGAVRRRRGRGPAAPGPGPPGGRAGPDRRRRRQQVPGQAGLDPRQAGRPAGRPARAGPRLPAPAAGRRPLGGRPGHHRRAGPLRPAHRRRRRRHPQSDPGAGPRPGRRGPAPRAGLGPRRPRGGAVRGGQVGRLRGDLRRRHRRPRRSWPARCCAAVCGWAGGCGRPAWPAAPSP